MHLPEPPTLSDPSGQLNVQLIELEAGGVLYEWSRAAVDLRRGWNRFSTTEALSCKRFSAGLKLSASTGISLSMGENTAVAKAMAKVGDKTNVPRPFAFRVWLAVPGTTSVQAAVTPSGDEVGMWSRMLPSLFDELKLILPQNANAAFPLFVKGSGTFLLHPWKDVASAVTASVTLPADLAVLRIRAVLADKRSQPVEVAAGFIAGDATVAPADLLTKLVSSPYFSGWSAVQPTETAELVITAPGAATEGVLCFAAKMKDPLKGFNHSLTEWSSLGGIHV